MSPKLGSHHDFTRFFLFKYDFNGKYLVIINKSTTDFDNKANLVINENMKKIFSELH